MLTRGRRDGPRVNLYLSSDVFDGGRGTADMALKATEYELVVFDFRGPDYEFDSEAI